MAALSKLRVGGKRCAGLISYAFQYEILKDTPFPPTALGFLTEPPSQQLFSPQYGEELLLVKEGAETLNAKMHTGFPTSIKNKPTRSNKRSPKQTATAPSISTIQQGGITASGGFTLWRKRISASVT